MSCAQGYARALARTPQSADDITQETLLHLLDQAQRTRIDNPGGWLWAVARRVAARRYRKRPATEEFSESASTPSHADSSCLAHEILAGLSARDRELLKLRAAGLSYREMAVRLGVRQDSIGTLLTRARERARHLTDS